MRAVLRYLQARGVLNRCPHVMHFMFTRAAGPACVNGWVFADPHMGHGGRGRTRRASADWSPERLGIAQSYAHGAGA